MYTWRNAFRRFIVAPQAPVVPRARGARRVELSCEPLEGRITPSHSGVSHHLASAIHIHRAHHATGSTSSTTCSTSTTSSAAAASSASTTSGSSTTDSGSAGCADGSSTPTASSTSTSDAALSTALQTLRNDIQTVELASSTPVGQLTAIRAAFQTLSSDGLTPSSRSTLQAFEDSLVTTNATTPGSLTGNATLLAQFEALFTGTPTTHQTTDLTTAYDALAAAVTSANITTANITTIDTDWAAVLTAQGGASTATFAYFSLVTGETHGHGGGFGVC